MSRTDAAIRAPSTLTMVEASADLGVSRRWLQDFLKANDIPYLRAGHKKLFDAAAMHALKEAMRCPTNSSPRRPAARRSYRH